MEQKECEFLGCCTHYVHFVTLNFDLTHDIDLVFSRSNFKIALYQHSEGRSIWNESDESQ